MRALVILLALGLVPVFVVWQKHQYDTGLRFERIAEVDRVLNAPEFDDVRARVEHLDVTLSGTVSEFDLRRLAEARVDALDGVRVRAVDNRIRITPVLSYRRDATGTRIDGRLHSEDLKTLETVIARQPDPRAPVIEVRGYPLVKVLEPRQRRLLLAAATDFMSLPGPRSLALSGDQVVLQGSATLALLARLWEQAGRGADLEQYLYRARLYPSVYHLPGYRAETGLDEATQDRIRERLAGAQPVFPNGAVTLGPGERDKIERLADAVRLSGGRARFVIGGHVDPGHAEGIQAGIELGHARAEAVRRALTGRGLADDLFEVIDFGPTRLAGEPEAPGGGRVEVLLK